MTDRGYMDMWGWRAGMVLACCVAWTPFSAAADVDAEERAEDRRIAEVLGADANYTNDLFRAYRNPDINLEPWVRVGERLKFQATWKGFPAGGIELMAKRLRRKHDKTGLVVEMLAEPNDFLRRVGLYGEKTKTQSYLDLATGQSYYYRREQTENERRIRTETVEFDADRGQAYGWRAKPQKNKRSGDDVIDNHYALGGPVQDPLSVFYYARGLGLSQRGERRTVIVASRKMVDLVTLNVVGEETVDTGVGRFDCLIVRPTVDDNSFVDNLITAKGAAYVWLEKNTMIPVRIRVELRFGEVNANLIEAENAALTRYAIR